jgi:peroxiredoxin Q/BCP
MIKEGNAAPQFSLENQDGKKVGLSDYLGKPIVLYFYPKDDTPGCTTEACGFRDGYSEYRKLGAEILGISPDSVKSHQKFQGKYDLPFTLLSDPAHQVAEQYGVWGLKKNYGREYEGIFRTTFLIGKDGKVSRVFEGVKPSGHSQEVLEALKNLL